MSVRLPEELAALREPLSDWAARQHSDMVVTVGEDHGLDHGRLCWDALRAVDLIGPACWCPAPVGTAARTTTGWCTSGCGCASRRRTR
ncbi:hypothetical protein ACFQ2M_22405 [Kitasatospora saccharophila]|uniref:hypothetical protein n=1 Tax=Kitasatospora saccharophila TaxID=407973 RepID=UPI003636E06E